MINYLIKRVYNICYKNESIPRNQKKIWHKLYFNGLKLFFIISIELFLTVKFMFYKNTIPTLEDDGLKPIVSITTFPKRISYLWIVLNSIYSQTYLPAKIILVLTIEEFPNGIESLPKSIKRFIGKGLEVVFTEQNLRPHNKYFYTFKKYTNRGIITLDDDLYYWPDTIERLVKLNYKYPTCVCANSVEFLNFENNKLTFKKNYQTEKLDIRNMALGYNGVFYPTNFRSEEIFNIENIVSLSLNADDLWLKAQALITKTDVIVGEKYITPLFVLGTQKIALRFKNLDKNENEIQWKKLHDYYKLSRFLHPNS